MLYTILTEYKGGTYVSQVTADRVDSALRLWAERLDVTEISYFGREHMSILTSDELMSINIVATVALQAP
jgi:hypothetical protein